VRALSSVTEGDLRQSARWRELYETGGMGDELRAALVLDGRCWGYLELLRERDERAFSEEEAMFVLRFAPPVATSIRRVLVADLSRAQIHAQAHRGPGTVILDQDFRPIASTREADQWMALLRCDANGIPTAVLAVAVRLRSLGLRSPLAREEARVRARAPTGEWVTVSASRLTGPALSGATAVTLEGSGSGVADLALEAYGLTARERELAKLVLEGLSNVEIAQRLFLSPYTVGDHVKAILEKVGTHSKRELIAGLLKGAVRQTADLGESERR
jgi:DNA-binding CsgD family transcriptional regulator